MLFGTRGEKKSQNFEKHTTQTSSLGLLSTMFLKYKFSFLFLFFLLVSTSLLSTTCIAGRPSKLVPRATNGGVVHEDGRRKTMGEMEDIHERLLRANTKDYGRYDPTPAFVKPPFKLIPN